MLMAPLPVRAEPRRWRARVPMGAGRGVASWGARARACERCPGRGTTRPASATLRCYRMRAGLGALELACER